MKQEKFTLKQAIAEIEIFYLYYLHKERGISMRIKTPPQDSVLAWYDLALDELFITDDLSKWTVELLYVLPIHEQIHKNCMGLINDYENGYHNIAFRTLFEKMSGMRTYHNNQVGWQFIEETGEKYFNWLLEKKNAIDAIFEIIAKTDLPKKEQEQDNGQGGQGGQGEQDSGQSDSKSKAKSAMNKALAQNSKAKGESDGDESEQQAEQSEKGESDGDDGKGDKNTATDTAKGETPQSSGNDYKGQQENIEFGNGKKRFKI